MARRANPAAGQAATEEHEEQTPHEGGEIGIPQTGAIASAAQAPPANAEPEVAPARFMVEQTRTVAMGGMPTIMRAGKVVDASTYDLDELRRQGVALRQISG